MENTGGTSGIELVSTNIFDKETIYTNCTVQVWENSITGEISIGWYPNEGCEEITEE